MIIETKMLIPNKEWILKNQYSKLGTINKVKKGFNFLKNGQKIFLNSKEEIKNVLGFDVQLTNTTIIKNNNHCIIYEYPCSSKPYNSIFDLRKKIALFSKSSKSKSKYCAGYFLIKFRKGWVKSFCPKLITIERYPYNGPFKSEDEMKIKLYKLNKNETS